MEILSATRFMYWTTAFACDLVWLVMFTQTHRTGWNPFNWTRLDRTMVGIGGAGISITAQQWFWWRHEYLTAEGRCDSHDPLIYNAEVCATQVWWQGHAGFTQILYFTAVFFLVLAVNGALSEAVSRSLRWFGWDGRLASAWFAVGLMFPALMWIIGIALHRSNEWWSAIEAGV